MDNPPLTVRWVAWLSLLAVCVYAFYSEATNSMPIEVFSIVLAGFLVLAAYLLQLKNKYFLLAVWIGFIVSTISISWFLLLNIAAPFGTETTAAIYTILIFLTCWWRLRSISQQP
jgi:uncharacterized membrane protein YdjX (TVP38/TMEM64 family)